MTEWDHGHDGHDGGPDLPGEDPTWEAFGSDAHLPDHSTPDDPYGSPDHPEPIPHDAAPDEPAGLPEEPPADWSGSGDEAAHAWEPFLDPGDHVDGTDPAGWSDAGGADPFPPTLDVDVQPGYGGPWVDPQLLGGADQWAPGPDQDAPAALLPDLAAADGDPDAGWDALRDSDDPAVRALTHHWNP